MSVIADTYLRITFAHMFECDDVLRPRRRWRPTAVEILERERSNLQRPTIGADGRGR